jgi:hypothetical protein
MEFVYLQEEFEDIKGVIRIRKWQEWQWPKEKGQTTIIYKHYT